MFRWRTFAVSLVSAVLFLMPNSSPSAETLVVTDEGLEYPGEVIDAGVNTLTMKLRGSGYQIVPVNSIAWIRVDLANGAPIEGKLIDWSEGEMIVRVGDRDVSVRDGVITSVIDVGVAVGGPELSPPSQPAADDQPSEAGPSDPADVPTNATM
jgi:hypothetical protein